MVDGPTNKLFDPVEDALDEIKSGAKSPSAKKQKKNDKYSNAVSGLKSAEEFASATTDNGKDGLGSVRKKESEAGGLYSGSGKKSKNDSKKGSVRGKWLLKKGGPLVAIFALILGVGGLFGGGQALLPFSLISQFQETFNSMHVSAGTRSNALVRYQMDHDLVKDPIKSRIFREDTFKITNRQASKLAARGIEYDDDFEGSGTRVLKYDDGSGEIKIIAADETAATRLTEMDLSRFNTDNVKYNTDAVSFKNIYESDSNFFKNYNDGSMTWRGVIANWFGSTTMNFLKENKLTRNLFRNFDQELAETGESPRTVATDMIARNAEEIDEGGVRVATYGEDEDGNAMRTNSDATNSGSTKTMRSNIQSEAEVKEKLEKIGDDYSGGSITGTAQKVANYACLGLNFLGGVSLLVSASEALQIIHLTTSYFEAIDKTKAGDGNDSPLSTLMDALTEKKVNKNVELEVKQNANISTTDMNANVSDNGISTLETKKTTTNKTAMESSGIVALYSNGKVDANDPSVKSFNFTSSIDRILGGLGTSMTAFSACAFAKLATNAVGAVQSGLEIAGCIAGALSAVFTFGTSASACSALIADVIIGAAISVGAAVLIAGIISTITPVVANMLTRDLIKNLGGEDLGNALTSGGNMYLGNTHRSNGGSLASEEKYIEYAAVHQQTIAEDAKQERLTKDPFNATSKYTFLGTLTNQIMGFMSVNSLTSAITSTSSVISSSLVALSPTASAYNIADTLVPMDEYEETCPYLASIGAVGDAFCNPYSITDVSTIEADPSEVTNILNNNFLDETTEDGNVQIDGSSDLAKYILFCDNRNSAFGIADQNIVNQVSNWGQVDTGDSTFNNVVNSAIGAVPVVGDIIDVFDNAEALANTGYIGGESCVAGNTVANTQAPNWETAKYYQRFIEDQSLMEGMGLIEESAVTAFLEDYYEKNPLDNSYEGMLARYSGLNKDTVVAILDVVEYGNYIANYNPSERYAFGELMVKTEDSLRFNNDGFSDDALAVLLSNITYADVRNRNFAV